MYLIAKVSFLSWRNRSIKYIMWALKIWMLTSSINLMCRKYWKKFPLINTSLPKIPFSEILWRISSRTTSSKLAPKRKTKSTLASSTTLLGGKNGRCQLSRLSSWGQSMRMRLLINWQNSRGRPNQGSDFVYYDISLLSDYSSIKLKIIPHVIQDEVSQ